MDPKYLIGIEEIDAQHREIDDVANAVIEAIESRDKWHLVHYIVVRLSELLRIHFAVEESVMRIVGFPEIVAHKKVHQEILQTIERIKVTTLDLSAPEGAEATSQQFSFLSHILDHDKKFAEFIAANISSLRR